VAVSAQAATIAAPACVATVNGSGSVPITGSGYTPGSFVTIRQATTVDPTPMILTSTNADAAGDIAVTASAPAFNPFARQLQTFGISATESVDPTNVATGSFEQVRVGYSTNPSTGKPTRRATHTVRGFAPGRDVYLHFRFGGQTKRNVKVGRASAPCGIASKRMALLPTRSHPGQWTVYVDQAKAYSKSTRPQLPYTFVISRSAG
jgi:hypothetical protein